MKCSESQIDDTALELLLPKACKELRLCMSQLTGGVFKEVYLVDERPMVRYFEEKLKIGNRQISNIIFLLAPKFVVDSNTYFEVGVKSTRTSPALSLVVLDSAMQNRRKRCCANLCIGEDELSSLRALSLPGKRDCCELISSPDPLIERQDPLNSEREN